MSDLVWMMQFAKQISDRIDYAFKETITRDNSSPANRQVLALAEETGEFVQAFRRWSRQARREGTREATLVELADVVITAFVTAIVLDFGEFPEAIKDRLAEVINRPFVDGF